MKTQLCIVEGSLNSGFLFVGPFNSWDDAIQYGVNELAIPVNMINIVRITSPSQEEEPTE